MAHKVWTPQGKAIIAAIIVITIVVSYEIGCNINSKYIKEKEIGCLQEPDNKKISQNIIGDNCLSLRSKFAKEISDAQKHLDLSQKLAEKYPQDSRPKENQKAWQKYISTCEKRFLAVLKEKTLQFICGNDYSSLKGTFDAHMNAINELKKRYPEESKNHISMCEERFCAVLKELFKPDNSTAIEVSSYQALKDAYLRKIEVIDERIRILKSLNLQYQKHNLEELVSRLESIKKRFQETKYTCPQHKSFCKKCLAQKERCKACGGKGRWGAWNWICQLCTGTGEIHKPGKTYCEKCKGLWDKGPNCKKCNQGLVACPSHDTEKTSCPICGTVDGSILGKNLEP